MVLHMLLFRLHHLSDIENVLFRSPFILRTLGFNARQIAEGFYATNGPRPFSAEALGDFSEDLPAEALLDLQLATVRQLRTRFPKLFEQATYAMDCFLVTCPPGLGVCQLFGWSSASSRCGWAAVPCPCWPVLLGPREQLASDEAEH